MEDNIIVKIRNLQVQMEEKQKIKIDLKKQTQDLMLDEKVRKYANLIEKIENFEEDIDILKSKIQKLENFECSYEGHHGVEFCYSNYAETNYYSYCLNCGQGIMGIRENMGLHRVIDGREYVKNNNITVSKIISKAKNEYHLLRECYYKYPGVLDDEKLNVIIYKVMRKRYETNN